MSTWSLLSRQHQELFRKIQLLEEASLSLLAKKTTHEKDERLVEDFLRFFKVGLTQHFKIEEEALFPILKSNVKDAEPLVSELVSEHKSMINEYFKLENSKNPRFSQTKDLIVLLNILSAHTEKEEKFIPPLIALLSKEQLQKINELARQLNYPLQET